MYTFISTMPLRQLLLEQIPALSASLIIAEHFFKFHSFTLECAAFLGTWYVIDGGMRLFIHFWTKLRKD